MVTLLCFCCEHRNPAGARFCNACGAPLNLKPCRRCETINERAAAHCHHCGETFELEFVTLDEAAQLPAADLAPAPAAVDSAPPGTSAQRVRTYLVAAAVALAAITATWFGVRLSEPMDAAVAASRPAPPPATGASTARDEPAPLHAAAAESPDRAPVDVADGPLADDDRDAVVPEGERAGAIVAAPPPPPRADAAKPPSPARNGASNGRSTQRAARSRPATAAAPPATEPPQGPMVMAVERPAPVAPRRTQSVRSVPPRARAVVRVEPAVPCSEGYALEPGCDLRTMPKGN